MKPLASRRAASGRSSVDERTEKINHLPREIDVRRWQALLVYMEHRAKRGFALDLAAVARKKGHENANMLRHIIKGRAALNEVWMLFIADGYGVAPQVIWKEDWPFPQLTPDFEDWRLRRVCQRWGALQPTTRTQITTLIRRSAASP